jgi:hypothetical protein
MRWKRTGVFTPQLIIDGIADGTGREEGSFNDILSRAIQVRIASIDVVYSNRKMKALQLSSVRKKVSKGCFDLVSIHSSVYSTNSRPGTKRFFPRSRH